MTKRKLLFIDRDGTIVQEPPGDYQLDDFKKLSFLPGVFTYLRKIALMGDYDLVMVTNQDGLGTDSFPEDTFWPVQHFIVNTLEGEGVSFKRICIDRSFPEENSPNRKPNTGMLTEFEDAQYDLTNSIVIGDRFSDMQLAKNLQCKGIFIVSPLHAGDELKVDQWIKEETQFSKVSDWASIYNQIQKLSRASQVKRKTSETDISISLNPDGQGLSNISTGIRFFDHMLEQIAKHGKMDLDIDVQGDLDIDEHHTIEDTAIALGEVFLQATQNKMGLQRYGFSLPMDDCLASVNIDFGGRPWLVWNAQFNREYVGKMPTEMFMHFFKSFSDAAKCNLHIDATGTNEHHKIEAIFKAFARAIGMAIEKNWHKDYLPSTKGVL